MIATAGDDVRIWDADLMQLRHHFYLDSSSKTATVSWSQDGRHMAAAPKYGNVIHLTELTAESPIQKQSNVGRPVSCAQFSQGKERMLGVGCMDGGVLLWDIKLGRSTGSYQAHTSSVSCLSFSNNNCIIATGSKDGAVVLCNMTTKQPSGSLVEPTGKLVTAVRFSVLSRYRLVSSCADGVVCCWDGASQKLVVRAALHPGVCCPDVALSPVHVALLASVGLDKRIVFYDLSASKVQGGVVSLEPLESVEFLGDGQQLLVGGTSGKLHLYDLRMASQPLQKTLLAHNAPVTCIRHCPQVLGLKSGADAVVTGSRTSSASAGIAFTEVPAGRLLSPQLSPIMPGAVTNGRHSGAADDSLGSVDHFVSSVTRESSSLLSPDWLCISGLKNRRPFRLSDILPVLPEADPIPPSPNVAEVHSVGAVPKDVEAPWVKTVQTEDAERTSVHGSSPAPQGSAAELQGANDSRREETLAREGCGDMVPPQEAQAADTPHLPGFQEELLRKLVSEEVEDMGDQLHAHMRHLDSEQTLELFRLRRDVHGMLQQIFDEVLALRRDLDALRAGI